LRDLILQEDLMFMRSAAKYNAGRKGKGKK
jgi:hypothetical protein